MHQSNVSTEHLLANVQQQPSAVPTAAAKSPAMAASAPPACTLGHTLLPTNPGFCLNHYNNLTFLETC